MPSSTAKASDTPAPAIDELGAAQQPPSPSSPAAGGRSPSSWAGWPRASVSLGAATGTFTPGTQRFAFALTTSAGRFVYAPTAIYIATNPTAPAKGPFLAPADPMGVTPQYRSKQNTGPGGIKAIYAAALPVPKAGTYAVLSLTLSAKGLIGAPRRARRGRRPADSGGPSGLRRSPPTRPPPSRATRPC